MSKKSLPDLALYIQNHPKADKIKGIIGITMLNRGADRLGFEFVSISNPLYKWFKWIAFIPICLLSGNNSIIKMIKNNISSSPQYLFMSKESLLERYPYKSLHEVSKRR